MGYIKGIDVSNNNGSIDFNDMGSDGVKIVYLKATEGQSFNDNTMSTFYADCKSLGLKVGAYHFLVGTSTPEVQAQNFYTMIKDYEWDCVPMMDVETSFDGLADYVERFVVAFNELSPLTLGIYSYTSFLDQIQPAEATIKDMPFWEANYNNDPWNLSDTFFTNRIGHQYTDSGIISGITSEGCDVDSFTDGVYLDNSEYSGEWVIKNSKCWYKHDDGSYTSNGWEKISNKWYYFDVDGWMVYDWKQYGNTWYYLGGSDDGAMKTGWHLINKVWYYFDDNGAMQTGWQKINDTWYFFDKSGAMQTGWIVDNNKDYCLYSTGEMVCNIDYIGYRFASDGVATKLN
jgi:lysozyme